MLAGANEESERREEERETEKRELYNNKRVYGASVYARACCVLLILDSRVRAIGVNAPARIACMRIWCLIYNCRKLRLSFEYNTQECVFLVKLLFFFLSSSYYSRSK